jgi:hypothetical protein
MSRGLEAAGLMILLEDKGTSVEAPGWVKRRTKGKRWCVDGWQHRGGGDSSNARRASKQLPLEEEEVRAIWSPWTI